MNKLSIYEHSIKDIKAAFYDIIAYEESQGNKDKLIGFKSKMSELLNLLSNELEEKTSNKTNEEQMETPNNIIPINFETEETKQEEQITPQEDEKTEEQIQQTHTVEETKPLTMTKIDNKKAKAILVLEKQINKLRLSKDEKKQELEKLIKENEEFMKSVSIKTQTTDTEKQVKELEEQVKKYYSENNFEMAEKVLNQIKKLSN